MQFVAILFVVLFLLFQCYLYNQLSQNAHFSLPPFKNVIRSMKKKKNISKNSE